MQKPQCGFHGLDKMAPTVGAILRGDERAAHRHANHAGIALVEQTHPRAS